MPNPSPIQAPATPSPTDLITKSTPAIEWLAENTDCPALPDRMSIEDTPVGPLFVIWSDQSDESNLTDRDSWATNDDLFLAAICVWVNGEAVKWMLADDANIIHNPSAYIGQFAAYIETDSLGAVQIQSPTYPEATIALLLAIVESLKGESK